MASLREGLEETLTVSRLNLSPSLLRTLKSTNPIESVISVARTVTGNVKRWRDGTMIVRCTAAGIMEAETQFRRINGFRDLQLLHIALRHTENPSKPLPSSDRRVDRVAEVLGVRDASLRASWWLPRPRFLTDLL